MNNEYIKTITSFVKKPKNKKIVLTIGIVLIVLVGLLTFARIFNNNSVASYSEIVQDGNSVFVVSSEGDGYLYKSNKSGVDAAKDYLESNPSFGSKKLLPDGYWTRAALSHQSKDSEDEYLKNNNFKLNSEHYSFDQRINNIPVFSAGVVVHLRNSNEIYSVNGNVSEEKSQTNQKISEGEAIQSALVEAGKEVSGQLLVSETNKFYVNKKLLGINQDSVDRIALEVVVESVEKPTIFRTRYFVDLENGAVLYSESEVKDAVKRRVYDCKAGQNCPVAREEGSSPSTDTEINSVYNQLGQTYDYFFNTFGRNSYDGNGATLNGYVHAKTGMIINNKSQVKCPNAFWNGYEMVFCTGLVVPDVTAHELSHAITSRTAGLIYQYQSGALNEAVSDIFGSAVDNNWQIGEGLSPSLGMSVPLRSMSNPPQRGNADRLYSQDYYCGSQDNGGVHLNSGVINKTFYLMTDGGNFNGCSVNGIGRAKSHPIVYRALVNRYLTQTSNFKAAYTAFLRACSDLYGAESSECKNVDQAMQATEIDQQPAGTQEGPFCSSIPRQTPKCAQTTPPTVNPATPTVSASTPTPTISQAPKNLIQGRVFTDSNSNRNYDAGESGINGAEVSISGGSTAVVTTTSTGQFSLDDAVVGAYTISAKVNGNSVGSATFNLPPNSSMVVTINFPVSTQSQNQPPVIVTPSITQVTPSPASSTPTPTSTPQPTIVPSTPTPTTPLFKSKGTPTPTPSEYYQCKTDPTCQKSRRSVQLCPLICTPIAK